MILQTQAASGQRPALPDWVPTGALHYIQHTEAGAPIRALARAAGCHASTVLRQIRKVEMRRDDPLVDAALRKLGAVHQSAQTSGSKCTGRGAPSETSAGPMPSDETLTREAMRVLRRLSENGAVLAVAEGLEKAVVVRDGPEGSNTRTAVVEASVAQAMALKDWITPRHSGRITRYQITSAGRAALTEFVEKFGTSSDGARGFAEAKVPFAGSEAFDDMEEGGYTRPRFCVGESPLSALARRRDKDGKRFLDESLVQSGERLREDYELSQMDGTVTQNWDQYLKSEDSVCFSGSGPDAPAAARARVASALADLGPGLADVVLRCCCYLEGLETTEKRLGWSARSGKIVLRIALMRLRRHYEETIGPEGAMIG